MIVKEFLHANQNFWFLIMRESLVLILFVKSIYAYHTCIKVQKYNIQKKKYIQIYFKVLYTLFIFKNSKKNIEFFFNYVACDAPNLHFKKIIKLFSFWKYSIFNNNILRMPLFLFLSVQKLLYFNISCVSFRKFNFPKI